MHLDFATTFDSVPNKRLVILVLMATLVHYFNSQSVVSARVSLFLLVKMMSNLTSQFERNIKHQRYPYHVEQGGILYKLLGQKITNGSLTDHN